MLPGTSTVWEYLMFHAHLRLPKEWAAVQKSNRVMAVAS